MEKIKSDNVDRLRKLISKDPKYIRYLDKDSVMLALQIEPTSIKFLEDATEEMQILALKKHVQLDMIKNPTERAKEIAIEISSDAIQYINNPSEDLIFKSLIADPYNIVFVDKPTFEMKLYYIKNYRGVICYFSPLIDGIPDDIVKELVEEDKERLLSIKINETLEHEFYDKYGYDVMKLIREPSNSIIIRSLKDGYRGEFLFNKDKRFIVDFILEEFDNIDEDSLEFLLDKREIDLLLLEYLPETRVVKKEMVKRKLKNK